MKTEILFTYRDCEPGKIRGKNAVVIDVLRATSVVVTALHNGATAIYPFESVEEALRRAEGRRAEMILGGERNADRIDGFDLGNSPLEYTSDRVRGREVLITTTNGTRALNSARGAENILVLAFLNVKAVAREIINDARDTVVVCSGTDGNFSADDALCAGAFVDLLCRKISPELDDAGRFVRDFYRMTRDCGTPLRSALAESLHLNRLLARGYEADVNYCLTGDLYDIAPVCKDGRITANRREVS